MWFAARRKHVMVLSLAATFALLAVAYVVRQPSGAESRRNADAESEAFFSRKISNEEGVEDEEEEKLKETITDVASAPQTLMVPSEVSAKQFPTLVEGPLTQEERINLKSDGILLLEGETLPRVSGIDSGQKVANNKVPNYDDQVYIAQNPKTSEPVPVETTTKNNLSTSKRKKLISPSFSLPLVPSVSYKKLVEQSLQFLSTRVQFEFKNGPFDAGFMPGKPVPQNLVNRILVVSTWRSGSSFLGDLIKSYPGVFYSFEPLHHLLKNKHLNYGPDVDNIVQFLRRILTCNYLNETVYVDYMRNNTYLIGHNTRIWQSCARNQAICFDKNFLSAACQLMPIYVMKTVRMGLTPAFQLMKNPSLNLKVILLVRDPRGALHSRLKLSWCKSEHCSNPSTVCNDLLEDLRLSMKVKKQFPDRFLLIRYEDLGNYPEAMAKKLLKFLGLSYNSSVKRFIQEHTMLRKGKGKKPGTYTTFRDSKTTTFAWRSDLNFTTVSDIQNSCKTPLNLLRLRLFRSNDEYLNTSFPVLLS